MVSAIKMEKMERGTQDTSTMFARFKESRASGTQKITAASTLHLRAIIQDLHNSLLVQDI